ncbi:MAG TPA: glycine--tRNA ligase subunit beta, partial [bacterium]|nr:glycine--tRNA ligase subunit beta [bacterium]
MKKGEFLLEIGCEDLPEWTGDYFRERWLPLLTGELKKARIDHGDLEFFTTPRRLVVFIREMNLYQEALVEEVTGPPVSAGYDASGCPTAAAIGFARAHGVRVEKLIQKEHRGRKVLVAVKHVPGVATRKVIVAVVTESLMKMEIPRAMSWGDKRFRFVRPVRWVLLLLDGRPVPGELFGLKIGRKTCGHRIRHPESFSVVSISDYLKRVREHRVILDLDARREKIVSSLKESIPAESSFDPAAVEQACRLAEDPIVVMGKVPDEFHSLPLEVIEAVVNKLKAIPIRDSRGCVCFGLVLEGVNNDVVRQNYEKVLADRLEDARFFLSQDAHKPLKAYQEDLRRIVYHPRWGSVFDRVERFQAMAMVAAEKIPLRDQQRENLIAAVNLCKNDLATQMVAEFPALQGVIGRIYASREGYPEEVSLAIEQHYWPRGAADRIPETMTGAIVAVIDRLESFCCFFLEGEEISGAGDPFGLKRAASGLVEIIWGRKLSLPLAEMIEAATKMLKPEAAEKVREAVLNFIRQRADSLLAGEGIPAG